MFRQVGGAPLGLQLVEQVLGKSYKLSSLNARSAEPGTGAQPMHVDMGALPDKRGFWVCNLIWALDDFTSSNGATEVVPGSHLWNRLPDGSDEPDSAVATVEAPRGSLIAINAHLWHRGTTNASADSRRALHAFFCRRDKPQQQYQKKMLAESTQVALDDQTRWLLALDDPENDALCAGDYQQSGFLKQ